MSQGIHLDQYHDSVVLWLKGKFSWLKHVECYPELEPPLIVPSAFVSVVGWELDQVQPGNGQLSVVLTCDADLVVCEDKPGNQLYARNAAMAFCAGVQNTNFDLPVSPALVISAEEIAFDYRLDGYVVWRVTWNQKITVGSSVFSDEIRDGIRFAINPGDDSDPDEYQSLEVLNASNG